MTSKIDDELPKSVQTSMESLEAMNAAMNQTDDALQLILGMDYDALRGQLTGLETAKLNVAMAFTLASLVYANMQCQGEDTTNHNIQEDLQRIKGFVGRINGIEKKLSPPTSEKDTKTIVEQAAEAENPKKRIKVDAKAAARVIKHNL